MDSSLLWDLLDYAASSSPHTTIGDASGGVELNISTQFLSPLTTTTPRAAAENAPEQMDLSQDDLLPSLWDDAEFEFDAFDFPHSLEASAAGLTRGLW